MTSTPTALLADAVAALRGVLGMPASGLSDAALMSEASVVEFAGRLLDARRVELAAELADRSRPTLGTTGLAYVQGHKNAALLLEALTRTSTREARARIDLGTHLRPTIGLTGERIPAPYPVVAEGVRSGTVGVDAARAIIAELGQTGDRVHPDAVSEAETALVAQASTECADLLRTMAITWRTALDPDGLEPRYEAQVQARRYAQRRLPNGMTRTILDTTPEDGAVIHGQVLEGLHRNATPRFLSDEDRANGSVEVPDPRSFVQRAHDIILGTFRAGIDASVGHVLASHTLVSVVVSEENLRDRAGVAHIDGVAEPVPVGIVEQILCNADYRTLMFDPGGEVINESHRERLFTRPQKDALAVRDGGCVWEGCAAPPSRCEAHHVQFWSHGGTTDIDNGALLCSAHHHMLHNTEHRLERDGGELRLFAPSGRRMRVNRHRVHDRLTSTA